VRSSPACDSGESGGVSVFRVARYLATGIALICIPSLNFSALPSPDRIKTSVKRNKTMNSFGFIYSLDGLEAFWSRRSMKQCFAAVPLANHKRYLHCNLSARKGDHDASPHSYSHISSG